MIASREIPLMEKGILGGILEDGVLFGIFDSMACIRASSFLMYLVSLTFSSCRSDDFLHVSQSDGGLHASSEEILQIEASIFFNFPWRVVETSGLFS